MNNNKEQIYKEKIISEAEILKAVGHPIRLCICCKLCGKSLNVSNLQDCLNVPQSTVSQHLAILKSKKIIEGTRNGVEIIYSLVNDDVKRIVEVLFKETEIP
ncbi:metalloregulator ArsR/SmtB family transcription factor [Clostridium sediminicola]|uniref:ArsR/SmtB family transcription factor n=1 Tax=Clostridium sediminicola TaxID=3114879 RepID=UPI0031F27DE9